MIKINCILRIFHNNKYVKNFKEIIETFNSFFANKYALIANKSILPSEVKLLTGNTLNSCHSSETDIIQIINTQDSKAPGHDMISIRMLKLYGEAICRALSIIFKTCLNSGKFPLELKKGNFVSIQKKDDK